VQHGLEPHRLRLGEPRGQLEDALLQQRDHVQEDRAGDEHRRGGHREGDQGVRHLQVGAHRRLSGEDGHLQVQDLVLRVRHGQLQHGHHPVYCLNGRVRGVRLVGLLVVQEDFVNLLTFRTFFMFSSKKNVLVFFI